MAILYTPRGRAREYSALAVNHYSGCSHGCRYCYVPTIPPWKFGSAPRETFHRDPQPRADVIRKLKRDCIKRIGTGERVLLSFTTDPYQEADAVHRLTRQVIQTLHAYGYPIQVLTKAGTRALYDLDLFTASDAFATTMTFLDPDRARFWEPNAATPLNRIAAIRRFHEAGIPTWVSLEPVLDPAASLAIIRETHHIVDLFKIGKLNHHELAATIDWAAFATQAVTLCESLRQPYYIKHDLASFLQPGALEHSSDILMGPYHRTVADIEATEGPQEAGGARNLQPRLL